MIKTIAKELLQTIVLALILFLVLRMTIQNTQVLYPSMMPTLIENQLVIINKAAYARISQDDSITIGFMPLNATVSLTPFSVVENLTDDNQVYLFSEPKRGDIIVFHSPRNPDRDFIKRIIGLPGETIELHRGKVIINNHLLNEPYVKHLSKDSFSPTKVASGSFFVMGDNRPRSEDSRVWGTIPLDSIVGKLWFRYWPPGLINSF
jgi:signal peptidase I